MASGKGLALGLLTALGLKRIPSLPWQVAVFLALSALLTILIVRKIRQLHRLGKRLKDEALLAEAFLKLTPEELDERLEL